jgi:hypothetical protein
MLIDRNGMASQVDQPTEACVMKLAAVTIEQATDAAGDAQASDRVEHSDEANAHQPERANNSLSSAVRAAFSPSCISRKPGAFVSRYRAQTAFAGSSVSRMIPHLAIMPARLRAAKAPRL